jgi:hypothetical protein
MATLPLGYNGLTLRLQGYGNNMIQQVRVDGSVDPVQWC